MSLSLAKRSLRSFELADTPKDQIKKNSKPVFKPAAKQAKQQNSQDEKIKKLLLIGTTSMDDIVSKRLLRKATNKKASKLRKSNKPEDIDVEDKSQKPATGDSVFTEEDFKNFAEELKKQNG